MKKILIGLVVVVVSAAAYFVFSDVSKEQQTARGPSSRRLYSAIRTQMESLESSLGARVDLLVPGEVAAPSTWNFRGTLRDANAPKPFFGTIRSVCEVYLSPDCWELVTLSVDGLSVFSEEAMLPATRLSEIERSGPDEEAGRLESEKLDQEDVMPMETAFSVERPDETAQEKSPEKHWYTRTDNVNGRLGPGTEYEIAFKIPSDLPLTLTESTSDWGLYKYPASNGKDGKIWIWMPLVEQR